ncbi:hypothetical protein K438DRAFT_1783745 [Mycena galopus ATCC 62051]|nr:hypothetical protein K438DRAFT_1783745 [Mycena galopus ATCC 62051]
MKAKIASLEKQISMETAVKKKKTLTARAQDPDDDALESEEPMSGQEDLVGSDDSATFSSATVIKSLRELPLPPQIPKPVKLRQAKRSTEPKTAARAFVQMPEGSADALAEISKSDKDEMDLDDAVTHPLPRSSSPSRSSSPPRGSSLPRSSSPPLGRPCSSSATGSSLLSAPTAPPGRYKRPQSPTAPLPLPKRTKPVARTPELRQGFTQVAGVKPAAGDYTDIPHALILRACADYAARNVAREAFPDVPLRVAWGEATFKSAGRVARDPHLITDRISLIICARGSQKRGKVVEAFRALCAPHFGFDPKTRTGYGGNKIITATRQATTFKATDSSGVLFPSYFDPYPLPAIALDFSAVSYPSGRYRAEKWSKLDEDVVKKIRHNWYRRASETFVIESTPQLSTNIDDKGIEALRAELAGRTGDTESESEVEIALEE